MKLEVFLVLQHRKNILEKNLIDVTSGSDISINELWNRIHYKVEEYVAVGAEDAEIKEMVSRMVGNYELRTSKIEKKTKLLMKKWGFNLD